MTISELKNTAIIVTSDEPYSKMWHTQLMYTEFLAKHGCVFFIDPPKKWKPINLLSTLKPKNVQHTNLVVLNYVNKLPASLKRGHAFNEKYNEKKIAKILQSYSYQHILIWHFDSYRSAFINSFFNPLLLIRRIYHVIDPFYKNPIDRWLCMKVNKIVLTSPRNSQYYSEFGEKIILIPQSLDLDLQLSFLNGKPTKQALLPKPYAVLLGTISDDIDFKWLQEMLDGGLRIVIIGKVISLSKQVSKWESILKHQNVDYKGLLSPEEFYPVLKNACAGLILYNEERRSKVCSPLKALNYLVSNLPVITNIDCEIKELINQSVFYSESCEEYIDTLKKAVDGDLKINIPLTRSYLDKNSLSKSVAAIIEQIHF